MTFGECDECKCKHYEVITSKDECDCECHTEDLVE